MIQVAEQHASMLPADRFQSDLEAVCGRFVVEPGARVIRGGVAHNAQRVFETVRVSADVQTIRRGRGEIATANGEHFFLITQQEGHALMRQGDQARQLGPGDMILIDSAQPSEFTFSGRFGRQLSVHLPHEEMRRRFGDLARGGIFLPHGDPTNTALIAVLVKALASTGNPLVDNWLREAAFGLLGVLLVQAGSQAGGQAGRAEAEIGTAREVRDALRLIAAHHTDPEFTVAGLAARLRLPMRQLQRAFSLLGTTPTAALLEHRLQTASRMLASQPRLSISQVAWAAGFNDLSYFNRVFRRAHGLAPREWRATQPSCPAPALSPPAERLA